MARIKSVSAAKFRRFENLAITEIPETARLVVLAGPNGSGKSSLFDAFVTFFRLNAGRGWSGDQRYVDRSSGKQPDISQRIVVTTHDGEIRHGSLYVRSAYRNDPDFHKTTLNRQGPILEGRHVERLIEGDATVSTNYERLASEAMEAVFVNEPATTTMGDFRDKMIGECRDPLKRLFPDLTFVGIGNPLEQGTFQFDKGTAKSFDYKNLSGGEKAAFDLILDFVVKRKVYDDAVYCIDEPETHMSTKLQGALLGELMALLPEKSQLWIGSHSIGMMRKARELYDADPDSVVFLDFGGQDFDQPVTLKPTKPTRAFWENILHVALDDLASLVTPAQIIICEGNPAGAVPGKNAEHDAQVYGTIFAGEFSDVKFISGGNSLQVAGDFIGLAAALPKVAKGIRVSQLIDLDDHAPADVTDLEANGKTVLSRRHLEAYLYDDEVLTVLCDSVGKATNVADVLAAKTQAIAACVAQGKPADDIKSAAGIIYTETKKILGLTQVGNDRNAFARNTLAPLIRPGMKTYDELKSDIFK